MGIKAGYLVELDAVQFDEDTRAAWIQAMTIGKYYHPVHGEIELTPERIQKFAANVNSRVRTTDLGRAQLGLSTNLDGEGRFRQPAIWHLPDGGQDRIA